MKFRKRHFLLLLFFSLFSIQIQSQGSGLVRYFQRILKKKAEKELLEQILKNPPRYKIDFGLIESSKLPDGRYVNVIVTESDGTKRSLSLFEAIETGVISPKITDPFAINETAKELNDKVRELIVGNKNNNIVELPDTWPFNYRSDYLKFENNTLKKIEIDFSLFPPKEDDLADKIKGGLKKEEFELKSDLEKIGFDNSEIKQSIRSYQKLKGFEQAGSVSKVLKNNIKKDIKEGLFFSKSGKTYKTKKLKTPTRNEKFFELEPNFYVKFTDENKKNIDDIFSQLDQRVYLKDEIEVLSLVKDEATDRVLKQNFPNNHVKLDVPSMKKFVKEIKSRKRKTVFVLGHIEGKEFVTNLKNRKPFKLKLEDLKRIGDDLNVNIFPLGCNSGFVDNSSGVGNFFNSIDALNRLKPAVEENKSIYNLLKDLSDDNMRIIIDNIPFEDRGYLQARIYKRNVTGASVILGSGVIGLIIYKYNKNTK